MKVIVLTGLTLSGKTIHAQYVSEQLSIPIIETGSFVYKEVRKRDLQPITENVLQVVRECKLQTPHFFTQKALEHVLSEFPTTDAIFISGIKDPDEVSYLKEKLGIDNVKVVSFHASVKTRHGRLFNRDRRGQQLNKDSKHIEDRAMIEDISKFNLRDERELEYGIGQLMALADYVINTENVYWPYQTLKETLDEFTSIAEQILQN